MAAPRKVSYARLHEAYSQPGPSGLGNLPKTLFAASQIGIVMQLTDLGLEVNYKEATFLVPLANLVGVTFEPQAAKAKVIISAKEPKAE